MSKQYKDFIKYEDAYLLYGDILSGRKPGKQFNRYPTITYTNDKLFRVSWYYRKI